MAELMAGKVCTTCNLLGMETWYRYLLVLIKSCSNFVASEMSGALDTNAIFLLSVTGTVVVETVIGRIFIIDSLILIQLAMGTVFGVTSIWGFRTRYYKQRHPESEDGMMHFGGWGTHCRLLLCTIISIYALWFWTYSVAHPQPTCFLREDCDGLRTFLFTSLPLYGWTRYTHMVMAIGAVVYFGEYSEQLSSMVVLALDLNGATDQQFTGTMQILATVTFARFLVLRVMGRTVEWIPQHLESGDARM